MSSRAAAARPRTPALVLGSLVVAVCVLVGAVALTSRQQTPPTIAEFAPQAVAQIKQTLDEQGLTETRQAATAEPSPPPPTAGPSANPTGGPSASPTSAPIEVPRVRTCIGSPPRQTEDPQSPPCVPYFDPEVDNGGATSKGVTGDAITIALPQQFLEDLQPPSRIAEFFNTRYELYGRKLVLQPFSTGGCVDSQPDPAKMRADAVEVDEQLQVFATLAYAGCQGADHHYYDALADRGVISIVDGNLTTGTEPNYRKRSPYQWNVMAGIDTITSTTAEFVCASLAGRPPRHAGTAIASTPQRKFGVITTRSTDGTTPDLTRLRDGLSRCGVTPVERRDDQTGGPTRNGVSTMVALQDAGVTSVMCLCGPADLRDVYMRAASAQGYQPEWVQSSYINTDLDNTYGGGNAPPDQSAHVIGISFRNKLQPRQDMPWYWAVKENDSSYEPSAAAYYAAHSRYMQLLLLASGIQLAGPELTPETFARGLQRARFPNPGARGAPYFQTEVSYAGPRHTMSADASMFWFDPQRPGTIDPSIPGAICYVDRGRRHALGAWPQGEPAFRSGPCL
ncbi:MAG: hypothetical protein EPN99_00915 [Frankiales bacterium]|nr:MAG: hypothetical protein EPN99_00915 [Frankiales bacterium]